MYVFRFHDVHSPVFSSTGNNRNDKDRQLHHYPQWPDRRKGINVDRYKPAFVWDNTAAVLLCCGQTKNLLLKMCLLLHSGQTVRARQESPVEQQVYSVRTVQCFVYPAPPRIIQSQGRSPIVLYQIVQAFL